MPVETTIEIRSYFMSLCLYASVCMYEWLAIHIAKIFPLFWNFKNVLEIFVKDSTVFLVEFTFKKWKKRENVSF